MVTVPAGLVAPVLYAGRASEWSPGDEVIDDRCDPIEGSRPASGLSTGDDEQGAGVGRRVGVFGSGSGTPGGRFPAGGLGVRRALGYNTAMTIIPALLVATLAPLAPLAASGTPDPNALTPAEEEAGWVCLFDGTSADHWRSFRGTAMPEAGWEIADGALRKVAGAGGGDIVTRAQYKDFEFAFEWKVAEGANSGVMYRVSEAHDWPWRTGPEYQILDDAHHADGGDPKTSAAALYALLAADGAAPRPVGEWNTGRIVVVGNHLEHWLNGVRVVSCTMHDDRWKALVAGSKFGTMPGFGDEPTGHIALQDHGDDVWFRAMKVRDLTFREDRARPLLANGFEDWTHFLRDEGVPARDVWSFGDDGRLICRGHPAGYLRTAGDFTNYVLRLRWRFDPDKGAGNSGVLLRVVGEDRVWPRSIEAQLQSGAAGDFWRFGGFPMQSDPTRTRGRNTKGSGTNERPIGAWNEYEITVWKGHVVLRVNGAILNQAWDCEEVAGKIGLQSEGAEIHFKDLAIVPLP